MLDQPVPNPLAKNPNVHTHKVFASVGLILIGTIIAIAGIWWYMGNQAGSETDDSTTQTTNTATPSAEQSSNPTSSETDDWKTYTSTEDKFTIKYPPTWVTESSETNNTCDTDNVFFAPSNDLLGKCNSGFAGIVQVGELATGYSGFPTENLDDLKTENSILAGYSATKTSGVLKGYTEETLMAGGPPNGTVVVTYIVDTGNKKVGLHYRKQPTWDDVS